MTLIVYNFVTLLCLLCVCVYVCVYYVGNGPWYSLLQVTIPACRHDCASMVAEDFVLCLCVCVCVCVCVWWCVCKQVLSSFIYGNTPPFNGVASDGIPGPVWLYGRDQVGQCVFGGFTSQ